jgi:hypothetical protein
MQPGYGPPVLTYATKSIIGQSHQYPSGYRATVSTHSGRIISRAHMLFPIRLRASLQDADWSVMDIEWLTLGLDIAVQERK